MTYDDLPGLHYITPIENLPSIFERGILSHARVEEVDHESVADSEVQERRAEKRVTEGRPLHEYVNLYFHARNPMMYKRRGQHEDLCVLSIHKRVLKQEEVVIADRNASSKYVRFGRGADDLEILDDRWVYARDWTHPNRIAYMEHRSVKCAEALIPDRVAPTHVRRIFVSCKKGKERVKEIVEDLEVKVNADLFFQ